MYCAFSASRTASPCSGSKSSPARAGRSGRRPCRCGGGSATEEDESKARNARGPGEGVVVVGVDERAVDVEDGAGQGASALTLRACASCSPSQNSSTTLAQKAGRSSGLREVTRPSSTTTSSSTQVPPALRMSVFSDGHEVIVRPLQDVGLDQRPRGVADRADRLALLEEARTKRRRPRPCAGSRGWRRRPGARARRSRRRRLRDGAVDGERVGLVEMVEGLDLAGIGRDQLGLPPAASTAFQGSVSSTCSTPSGATRNAIRLPSSLPHVDSFRLGSPLMLAALDEWPNAPGSPGAWKSRRVEDEP